MAREYEMLFKLNAQMSSAYQQTFKTAQASFKNFGTEYRAMASTASDITAYQRQQSACESTKSKLDMLQQQYDNIQREMDETGNHSSDLQNKLLAKQAQIDKTTAAYQQQSEKLDAYKQRLQAAGVDTENLIGEDKRLRDELERLRNQYDQTGDESRKMGEKGADAMSELGAAIAAAGIVQGLKKIYQAYVDCINVAAEFEAGVSQIAATMGVTTGEIQNLSAFAKEMGATTSFTAVESADALNVLAMAGLSAEEQMAALPVVLNLAAAGAMDIATAAGYVTGAVKGFSDEMANAAYYADLVAKGATMANTNVDQLGDALSTTAATASSYGQEAESVTVALLRLAEQNVVGSEAATKLNRAMADLYTPTDEAAGALRELGIATYDERGNARDLNTVMDELNTALSAYSMEQQNAYKDTIFSMNGLQAFNKMTVSSTETVEKFWDGLENSSGSAAKQAATQLDNFQGSVTIMNSAIEGTKIALGELYQGPLQKIAELATKIFSGITSLIEAHPILTKAIVALTAGLAAFVIGLTAYIAIAKIAEKATKALTTAMAANPFLKWGAAIAGVVVALGTFIGSIVLADNNEAKLTATSQKQADHIDELNEEYEQVCESMGETSAEAVLLKESIDEETAAFEEQRMTLAELEEELDAASEAYSEVHGTYKETVSGINAEYESTMSLISKLGELTSAEYMSASSKEQVLAIVDVLNERLPGLGLQFDALTGKINLTTEQIIAAANAANEAANRDAAFKALQGALEIQEKLRRAAEHAHAERDAAADNWMPGFSAYRNEQEESLSPQERRFRGANNFYMPSINEAYDKDRAAYERADSAYQTAQADFDTNEQLIEEAANKLAGVTGEATDGMTLYTDELRQSMESLTQAYEDAYEAAYNSIAGQYKLWDDAAKVSATSVDDVITAQEKQTQYWTDYKTNIDTLLGFSGQIEGLSNMIATFGDGSAESVNMIAGMAEAAASGDPTKLQELVDAWLANKQAQDEASWSLADLCEGYSDAAAQLGEEFASAVDEWDLSKEAGNAGMNTVQGYIDAAKDMLPVVYAAYQTVGKTAIDAIKSASWYGDSTGDGYAVGTESATPGFHLVGENGPELMFFNGGEQVLDAQQTASLMRGPEPVGISLPDRKTETHSYGDIIINVNANGSGSEASPEDIAETVKVAVLDALGDLAEDKRRRAYV